MNQQPIEKFVSGQTHLEVHTIFATIQGEGPFCGTPAIFIRLTGCNLQCPLCDTDYTSVREKYSSAQLVQKCLELKSYARLVVITGGEPFRQDINQLVSLLLDYEFYVQVESNGTLPPSHTIMWSKRYWLRKGAYIVCSPKSGKINSLLEKAACCFKYVLVDGEINPKDGLPMKVLGHSAHPFVARPPNNSLVYVQPADEKNVQRNALNLQAAINSAMMYNYVLQLQIHKIIEME